MRAIAVSCTMVLLAVAALAQNLIWDNGDPDFVNGLCCERVGAISEADLADDVHTDQDWYITGAVWETVDDPDYAWDGTGDLIIYEYTGSGPGDPVLELWNVPNERELIGGGWGRPMYRYTISGLSEYLAAGDYYILLRPYTPGYSGLSYWLTSPAPPGSQSEVYFRSDYFSFPGWVRGSNIWGHEYDVNFKLYGIPEPATLLLLALGGLALLRRR